MCKFFWKLSTVRPPRRSAVKWGPRAMNATSVRYDLGDGTSTAYRNFQYTYSQAGALFGYMLLWTLPPIALLLVITQEMNARMGAVTGKGLSDLLEEQFEEPKQ